MAFASLVTSRIQSIVWRVLGVSRQLEQLNAAVESQAILIGKLLSKQNATLRSSRLRDYEYKVFSQWGEDGIVDAIVERVPMPNFFVEFGVENFLESNCRYLMQSRGWGGMVIDGNRQHIQTIKSSKYFWRHSLQAVHSFVTRENINELLASCPHEIGVLSVDIDGVDYHVLQAIRRVNPVLVICEYNALFGSARAITVPYSARFQRTEAHYSNLYFGASLLAYCKLMKERGYALIGTNSVCTNAFFLRLDMLRAPFHEVTDLGELCTTPVRESRDPDGGLSFLSEKDAIRIIRGLPVQNVESNTLESL